MENTQDLEINDQILTEEPVYDNATIFSKEPEEDLDKLKKIDTEMNSSHTPENYYTGSEYTKVHKEPEPQPVVPVESESQPLFL